MSKKVEVVSEPLSVFGSPVIKSVASKPHHLSVSYKGVGILEMWLPLAFCC